MEEFEKEVREQLKELRGDVKTILGELGNMKKGLGTTDGRVAIISTIVSAVVVGVVLAMMAGCTQVPPTFPTEDSLAEATVALVRPASGQAYCGGVVTRFGIMTAAHCVADQEVVLVGRHRDLDLETTGWDALYAARVVAFDTATDAAILEAPVGWATAPVRVTPLRSGEAVTVLGHPMSQPYLFFRGHVAALERPGHSRLPLRTYIPLDVGIMQGDSGGPVFDSLGYVVGTVSVRIGAHLGGAAPVSAALELLENR